MSAEKEFRGFQSKTNYTPIPNSFFSVLLPQIDDMAELKVSLHVFWALYCKKNHPKFISMSELRGDETLMSSIRNNGSTEDQLHLALQKAVKHRILLSLKIKKGNDETEYLYFLNSEKGQRAVVQIQSGDIHIEAMVSTEPTDVEEKPNIFTLYEQHIGILTPIIADQLKEAENIYPAMWINDAFWEAVSLNKRSWRYISRILEKWSSEGRDDGRTGKNSKKDISPTEYIRKYSQFTRT